MKYLASLALVILTSMTLAAQARITVDQAGPRQETTEISRRDPVMDYKSTPPTNTSRPNPERETKIDTVRTNFTKHGAAFFCVSGYNGDITTQISDIVNTALEGFESGFYSTAHIEYSTSTVLDSSICVGVKLQPR